jgi:monolysocardiolipin acyltransferase
MGAVGLLCKGFLSGLSRVETHGLEGFLKLLDEREDVDKRERGLITGMQQHSGVSGYLTLASIEPHIRVGTVKPSHTRSRLTGCRMDDPILWGILPLKYLISSSNMRWGLGSYDLCFTNKYGPCSLRKLQTNNY